jgi:hypothetical protein
MATHKPAHQDRLHPPRAPLRRKLRPRKRGMLLLPLVLLAGLGLLAGGVVTYLLWPLWPEPVTVDAPALPITVSGVTFNVPPAAIRAPVQRRPGAQERVDLAFQWPALTPPEPTPKGAAPPAVGERLFVTIARDDGKLPPAERLKTVYPRYLTRGASDGPGGLVTQPFRDGTPYQGEDLVYQASGPERFFARCTRASGGRSGICLSERRIGGADLTFRFPREWLADGNNVAASLERLITQLRPVGG